MARGLTLLGSRARDPTDQRCDLGPHGLCVHSHAIGDLTIGEPVEDVREARGMADVHGGGVERGEVDRIHHMAQVTYLGADKKLAYEYLLNSSMIAMVRKAAAIR